MNCKKAQENLHEYLDGALSHSESATLRQHVEDCATCRQIVQRERDFATFLSSRLERAVEDARLDPRAQRRIAAAMAAKMTAKTLAPSRGYPLASLWMRFALGFAAATAVFLLFIRAHHRFGPGRGSQPQVARMSTPLTAPEISVNLNYCVPSYTFGRDGNTVVDALVCEPHVMQTSLMVKN
jgi:anti-sigma factor RsiW